MKNRTLLFICFCVFAACKKDSPHNNYIDNNPIDTFKNVSIDTFEGMVHCYGDEDGWTYRSFDTTYNYQYYIDYSLEDSIRIWGKTINYPNYPNEYICDVKFKKRNDSIYTLFHSTHFDFHFHDSLIVLWQEGTSAYSVYYTFNGHKKK